MALIAKSGTPSLCTPYPSHENAVTGLFAGEAIAAGDVCYIAADGTVMRSNGTAATAPAVGLGMAAGAASTGEAVTIFRRSNFHYGAGLTPGTPYFVGATAGRLDTVATVGGTVAVARAIDATRIAFSGQP